MRSDIDGLMAGGLGDWLAGQNAMRDTARYASRKSRRMNPICSGSSSACQMRYRPARPPMAENASGSRSVPSG